jgi:hypothetical protein
MVTGATTAAAAAAGVVLAARCSCITRLLTTPRKVADLLDWRRVSGSILTLTISRDRLDLAVSSHPIHHDEPLVQLPSVPLEIKVDKRNKTTATASTNVLCPNVAKELDGVCERFAICGVIVNWPVEKDGWCGFSCGRVLFTLDQLVAQQSKAVSTRNPFVSGMINICIFPKMNGVELLSIVVIPVPTRRCIKQVLNNTIMGTMMISRWSICGMIFAMHNGQEWENEEQHRQ